MAVELTFWEPLGTETQSRSVARPDEIEVLADDLLTRYQAAGDMLPGIELSTAIIAVSRWLVDGALAPELTWSDQCY